MDNQGLFTSRFKGKLSLKIRLWARLVEKLVAMSWEKDSVENIYRFFDGDGEIIILRIIGKSGDEDFYWIIELLNVEGDVLAKEELHWNGAPLPSYKHHPLNELLEIVGKEIPQPEFGEIQNLARLLNT